MLGRAEMVTSIWDSLALMPGPVGNRLYCPEFAAVTLGILTVGTVVVAVQPLGPDQLYAVAPMTGFVHVRIKVSPSHKGLLYVNGAKRLQFVVAVELEVGEKVMVP